MPVKRAKEGSRKDQISLSDMTEADVAPAMLFAVHRYLQPDYGAMAKLSDVLTDVIAARSQSGWEHKFRDWRIYADLMVEAAGGAGKAVDLGCKVKSEREIKRLINEGELPRGWKVPAKTNVPKIYDSYDTDAEVSHDAVGGEAVNEEAVGNPASMLTQKTAKPIKANAAKPIKPVKPVKPVKKQAKQLNTVSQHVPTPHTSEDKACAESLMRIHNSQDALDQQLATSSTTTTPPTNTHHLSMPARPRVQKRRHQSDNNNDDDNNNHNLEKSTQPSAEAPAMKYIRTGRNTKEPVVAAKTMKTPKPDQPVKKSLKDIWAVKRRLTRAEKAEKAKDAEVAAEMKAVSADPTLTIHQKVARKVELWRSRMNGAELPMQWLLTKHGFGGPVAEPDADSDTEVDPAVRNAAKAAQKEPVDPETQMEEDFDKEITSLNDDLQGAKRIVATRDIDKHLDLPEIGEVWWNVCQDIGWDWTPARSGESSVAQWGLLPGVFVAALACDRALDPDAAAEAFSKVVKECEEAIKADVQRLGWADRLQELGRISRREACSPAFEEQLAKATRSSAYWEEECRFINREKVLAEYRTKVAGLAQGSDFWKVHVDTAPDPVANFQRYRMPLLVELPPRAGQRGRKGKGKGAKPKKVAPPPRPNVQDPSVQASNQLGLNGASGMEGIAANRPRRGTCKTSQDVEDAVLGSEEDDVVEKQTGETGEEESDEEDVVEDQTGETEEEESEEDDVVEDQTGETEEEESEVDEAYDDDGATDEDEGKKTVDEAEEMEDGEFNGVEEMDLME